MADDYDTDFASGVSQASETFPKQCSALRKNEHVVIKGKPCKIAEMSTSKTGKHGHAKVHMVGIGIFDGRKYEDICPSTHNMNVPNVSRIEYQVIDDINDDGYVTLMAQDGDTREDIKVDSGAMKDEITKHFNSGADTFVTVVKAMGEEKILSCKKVTAKD